MEAAPRTCKARDPRRRPVFVNKDGRQVPLTAFARIARHHAAVGQPPGRHAGQHHPVTAWPTRCVAVAGQRRHTRRRGRSGRAGVGARQFQRHGRGLSAGAGGQPLLILAAIVTIYLVLGMLCEDLDPPVTILSTLPRAGVQGAAGADAVQDQFSLIALIGVMLLIGIVKKNAILMIDPALDRRRKSGAVARAGHLPSLPPAPAPHFDDHHRPPSLALPLALEPGSWV